MLKCKCLKCGAECGFENDASGHKFVCDCGAEYVIPDAPPAGDFRICFSCGKINESEAVVCTGCGFNFINNRKPSDKKKSADREPVSPKGAGVIKTLGWLLLAAVAAAVIAPIVLALTKSRVGATSASPLGSYSGAGAFDHIDFKPVKMKLPADKRFEGAKTFLYAKPKKVDLLGMGFEHLFMITDKDGRVMAYSGRFARPITMATTVEAAFYERLMEEFKMPVATEYKRVGPDGGLLKPTNYERSFERKGIVFHEKKTVFKSNLVKSLHVFIVTLGKEPVREADLSGMPQEYVNK